MKPLPEYERLHRQLEKYLPSKHGKEQFDQSQLPVPTTQNDPEVDALVVLACHVQQVHAGFAQRLEVRMLSRHVALRQQPPKGARQAAKKQRSWLFSGSFRTAIVVAVACFGLLLGTSLLALAASVTNPDNPFYTVKKWEQHIQLSFSRPPLDQPKASWQSTRDRLNTPIGAHGNAYPSLNSKDGGNGIINHISQKTNINVKNGFGNNNGDGQRSLPKASPMPYPQGQERKR